jgi:hypothetical protein
MGESAAPQLEHVTLSNGRRLALRRYPGTGAPLVALHGLFDCSLGWKQTARMMPGHAQATRERVVGGRNKMFAARLNFQPEEER